MSKDDQEPKIWPLIPVVVLLLLIVAYVTYWDLDQQKKEAVVTSDEVKSPAE